MTGYIERYQAIKIVESYGLKNGAGLGTPNGIAYCIAEAISIIPTADAVPVRHGRWVHTDHALHWTAKDECSECTYHALDRDDLSHYNYCPN